MHAARGTEPLGVKALRKVGPDRCIANPDRSPKPLVHAASRERRLEFRGIGDASSPRTATPAKAFKDGALDAKFPPGCFPPRRPFVPLRAGP